MHKGVKRLRQMENSVAVQTTEDREVGLGWVGWLLVLLAQDRMSQAQVQK